MVKPKRMRVQDVSNINIHLSRLNYTSFYQCCGKWRQFQHGRTWAFRL